MEGDVPLSTSHRSSVHCFRTGWLRLSFYITSFPLLFCTLHSSYLFNKFY